MDLSHDITIGGVAPSMVKLIEFKIRGQHHIGHLPLARARAKG